MMMEPRNKLFIRNGEKWTRILFSWTAGGEQTRSLQLYRLSANVCILEPQWLQHSCQVSKRPNDPSTHLPAVLLHLRYVFRGAAWPTVWTEYIWDEESGDWIGLGHFLLSRSDLHKTLFISGEAFGKRMIVLGKIHNIVYICWSPRWQTFHRWFITCWRVAQVCLHLMLYLLGSEERFYLQSTHYSFPHNF